MDTDKLEGKWEQLKGSAQRNWGKLTNDDLDIIEGDSKKLAGKLQERYGMSKEEAEKQIEDFRNQY
ncbi:MAG TPA: CsbD family protein [Tissierellaceae bacterium]|nr:CsbD family protein [Tissierellaceae bacterium]